MRILLLSVLYAFMQAFAAAGGISMVLTPGKTGKKRTFLLVLLGIGICNTVSVLIPYFWWKPFAGYALIFLWICYWYDNGWRETLLYFTLLYGITIPVEGISIVVLGKDAISAEPLDEQMLIPRVVVSVLLIFVQTGWMYLIRHLRESWSESILNKFYAFLLSQFVLDLLALQAVGMNYMQKTADGRKIIFDGNTFFVYRMGMVIFIVITILVYYLIFHYMKKEYLKEQIQKRENEMTEDMKYYRSVEEKSMHMRKVRHDIGNHLQMVESLMEEDPEKAQEYLAELKRIVERM